jgi:peptidoglycan-associated lipoprotein
MEVRGMKRATRVAMAVLLIPAAGVVLLGCPKKVAKTDQSLQPKVTESVRTVGPGSGADANAKAAADAAAKAAAERKAEEQRVAQLLASRGEDIPIKEAPAIEFVEPSSADKAVLKPVYFDYDKSNIRPEYQPVLEGIAKWLTTQADRQLLVEGHCDERGTDEYNLALGERRALAVRRYLVALGVSADRVHTISYGEEKPAVAGHDEAAWAKNRRAEFKVSAQ